MLTHVRAQGLALSHDSTTLYIADKSHHQIKKVELSDTGSQIGNASAVCGQPNTAGSANGIATSSTLNQPGDLAVTPDGTALIVADTGNHLVRKILLTSQGPAPQYSTYSLGYPGETGFVDGRDNSTPRCRFDHPFGLAIHQDGRTFVVDRNSAKIRMISADFMSVSSMAHVVDLSRPQRLVFYNNFQHLIVSSSPPSGTFFASNHMLTEISIQDATRVRWLGGVEGHADGVGVSARFRRPTALAWTPEGALLVGDSGGAIRVVRWDSGEVGTLTVGETGIFKIDGEKSSAYT